MKQTAVNKLSIDFRAWQRSWDMYDKDPLKLKKPKNFDEFIQPYLAMEKEQKREDFTDGYMHGNEPLNHDVIDKWYNETYKNK